jgi:hypothetical protein
MIDYVKINNLAIGQKIQDLIDFEVKVNQRTGEEYSNRKKSAYKKNLVFTITPGERYAKFQGSVHKYANGGELNNDRFTLERFLMVISDLREYVSPDDIINVLEFGINIKTPFDPTVFINNTIIHLKNPINKTLTSEKIYSQTEYSNYVLKIYNKGIQQPSGDFILRIEVKYLKMQRLFPEGLKWSDLGKSETWNSLGQEIIKKFSGVIYYDPSIKLKTLPTKDGEFIEKGRNPIFWQDLSGPHVSRIRKQYQTLIKQHGKLFNSLPSLIEQELKEVVKCSHFSDSEKSGTKTGQFPEMVNCYPLLYGNISPIGNNRVVCQVTGNDISMQKPGSKFLCISGLRFLYKNDYSKYEKLKNSRLSEKWQKSPLDIQLREIAHSIRNEYFNPKHDTARDIKKLFRHPALFENWPLISEEKRNLISAKNSII